MVNPHKIQIKWIESLHFCCAGGTLQFSSFILFKVHVYTAVEYWYELQLLQKSQNLGFLLVILRGAIVHMFSFFINIWNNKYINFNYFNFPYVYLLFGLRFIFVVAGYVTLTDSSGSNSKLEVKSDWLTLTN